jgi:hypothetical protein
MYKTMVRAMVRRGLQAISAGNPLVLIKKATPSCELAFPGDNSWAAMFRPVVKGRQRHVTHRGVEECRAFADRFVAEGVQFEVEDILVNGPPWRCGWRSGRKRLCPRTGRIATTIVPLRSSSCDGAAS